MKLAVQNALKNAYVSDNTCLRLKASPRQVGNLNQSSIFDNIGNRNSSTNNGVTTSYSANNLNQYTSINDAVPVCDLDGNMTEWNGWVFAWNGENRMIQATNSEHQISWAYDYMGRCFEKVKDGVTNGFVWDDYNIISEINNSHTNLNVWGLDLSHTSQGAGGVGGLLAVVQDGAVSFTAYDGNGNITAYVDAGATVVASREYSPFGETVSLTGTKQDNFTHWFSTKPWDGDMEISEYELRKLIVALGRFASKDPIEERGGLNLYGFVGNNGIGKWDYLGMASSNIKCCKGVQYDRTSQCCCEETGVIKEYVLPSNYEWTGECNFTSGGGTFGGGGLTCKLKSSLNYKCEMWLIRVTAGFGGITEALGLFGSTTFDVTFTNAVEWQSFVGTASIAIYGAAVANVGHGWGQIRLGSAEYSSGASGGHQEGVDLSVSLMAGRSRVARYQKISCSDWDKELDDLSWDE